MTHIPILARIALAALCCAPLCCRQNAKRVALDTAPARTEVREEHWPDGSLRSREHVIVVDDDGTTIRKELVTRWYDNGQREYEVTLAGGVKYGTARFWHRNGQVWIEERYVDGLKHGIRRVWNDEGRLIKEEGHAHGKPHGAWTTYHKDGRIKYRQHYDHGVPQS